MSDAKIFLEVIPEKRMCMDDLLESLEYWSEDLPGIGEP
jgi:hypothetical protein